MTSNVQAYLVASGWKRHTTEDGKRYWVCPRGWDWYSLEDALQLQYQFDRKKLMTRVDYEYLGPRTAEVMKNDIAEQMSRNYDK